MAQAYRLDDENKENAKGRIFMNFSIRPSLAIQVDQVCDSLQINRSKFFKSVLTYVLQLEDIEGFMKQVYDTHVEKIKLGQIADQPIRKVAVSRRSKQVVLLPEGTETAERLTRGRPAGSKNKKTLEREAAAAAALAALEVNETEETVEASIEE